MAKFLVQEWEEDAVGEGKDLLAQTDVLRVAHLRLSPDPGSCWVPDATAKWDWKLGDVTRVHLCWWPWAWLAHLAVG